MSRQNACLSVVGQRGCLPVAGRATNVLCLIFGVVFGQGIAKSEEKAATAAEQKNPSRSELLKLFNAEFVAITPGRGAFPKTFSMGSEGGASSERPARTVTLDEEFWMARYEVPQNLFEVVTGRNPSAWKGPRNSVEMVSWQEASDFCQLATRLMRAEKLISDEIEIRLPTEAEWEYCCRAGSTTAYSFGAEATGPADQGKAASLLDVYAWHTGNAAGNDPPVGAKKPNGWGLYDMHGYLWEFVADTWHENFTGAPADARPWDASEANLPRVIRGGSWRDRHDLLRSTTRWPIPDHARSDAVGFRCLKAKVGSGRSQ